MNMTVEEYRVAFGLPAGGAPAVPVDAPKAPAVALTPEQEKELKVAAKAAKFAAEANKETDKMNKLTEFVSPTPSASLSSSGSQHLSLRPVIHAIDSRNESN